jgi:dienelactone hydrolase
MRWIVLVACLLAVPVQAREKITLPSGQKAPAELTGWLAEPAGLGPFAAVVLLHGCSGAYTPSGKLNNRHLQWEEVLLGQGYAVLHLDSFGPRGVTQICTVQDRTIRASIERKRDAHAALAYLRTRAEIDPARIGLLGWSNGGSSVLAAMEEPGFRTAVAFYPGCRASATRSYHPAGPLLMLHGSQDNWTPPARCQEMLAAMRQAGESVEAIDYPGAYHDFDWPGRAIRTHKGVRTESGTAISGTNEPARLDALIRVPAFLRLHL